MKYCFHELKQGDSWRVPNDGRTGDFDSATTDEKRAMNACRNYARRHGWIVQMRYDWQTHEYLMHRVT